MKVPRLPVPTDLVGSSRVPALLLPVLSLSPLEHGWEATEQYQKHQTDPIPMPVIMVGTLDDAGSAIENRRARGKLANYTRAAQAHS